MKLLVLAAGKLPARDAWVRDACEDYRKRLTRVIPVEIAEVKTATHGLAGMKHRVEAAGGKLAVESVPGEGTRISASLPRSAQPA